MNVVPALGVYAYRYQKLKKLIAYVLSEIDRKFPGKYPEGVPVEIVLGVVFRTDFALYAERGHSYTELNYIKQPEGAVPEGFYDCVKDLVREKRITAEEVLDPAP